MKNKNLFYGSTIMMAAIAAFQLSSCNDEVVDTMDTPQQRNGYDDNRQVGDDGTKAITTLMFDQKGFVPISTNADTTSIQISCYFAHDEIKEGQYVAIWNSPNEPAFFVKVISAQSQDKGKKQGYIPYEIYNVERACASEVLNIGEYNFDLNPYVNQQENLRNADGRINYRGYYDEADQTYHPVAISVQGGDLNDVGQSSYYELPVARWSSPLVEEQFNANGSVDFKLFDLTTTITDFKVALGDSCGSFGLDKLFIDLKAGAHFRLDVGTKYLIVPYIQNFETAINGKLQTKIDVSLAIGKDIQFWDKSVPVIHFGRIVATFMVGPIPVSVDCSPTIDFKTKATAQGKFKIASHYEFETELQAGLGYDDKNGWKNLSNASAHDSLAFAVPVLYGQADANVGIMFSCPVKLYGVAGPKASAGPQIVGTFKGQINFDNGQMDCSGEVNFVVGGNVSAEISCMGYKLAKWGTDLTLWKKKLWSDSWSSKSSDSKDAEQMIDEAVARILDGVLPAGTPFTFISAEDLKYTKIEYRPISHTFRLRISYCQERGFTPTAGQYFVIWPEGQEKPDVIQLTDVWPLSSVPFYSCTFNIIK